MSRRIFSYALVAIVALAVGSVWQPFAHIPTFAQGTCHTFTETGHTVCGRFLDYWQTHGGLAQQGYPISEPFQEVSDLNGQTYTVQYFERAVFEMHPENQPPNDVLLSQLGTFRFKEKYPNGAPAGNPQPAPQPTQPPSGGQGVTFQGTTTQNTQPFTLHAGNYSATTIASDTSGYGCYMGAFIEPVTRGTYFGDLLANKVIAANHSETLTTSLYNIPAGQFYLQVNSQCNWQITIKPQ